MKTTSIANNRQQPRKVSLGAELLSWLIPPRVDPEKLQMVAIVSTGRTGTLFHAQMFNRPDLEITALHEPNPILCDLGTEFVTGRKPFEEVKRSILRHRRKIFAGVNGNIYVESNGCLILLLPALKALVKNLKVIHLVRNPVDFVKSGVNRVYRRNGEFVQTYAEEKHWQLRAADFPDAREDWASLDIYERFMWTWHFKNERARQFVLENPGCGLTVRFEDIFHKKNHEGFDSILNFLELGHISSKFDWGAFGKVVNPSLAALAEPYQDWPDRRKKSLERICGQLAQSWGYCFDSAEKDDAKELRLSAAVANA